LKILRPKKFEIWGKDVGMVWKLFVEGALCYNVAVGLRINDACYMNTTKKLATAAILLASASAFLMMELPKIKTAETNNGNPAAQMILYYGNSCPHCKTVENYIAENNLAEKLRIEQKEISSDRTNQDEFIRPRVAALVRTIWACRCSGTPKRKNAIRATKPSLIF
jgi:hypothetical protein